MNASSQPLAIARRAMDIEDYIDIARRHKNWIIGPFYAGIAISTVIAFLLPNYYVSRAILRITPAEVNGTVAPMTTDRLRRPHQRDVAGRRQPGQFVAVNSAAGARPLPGGSES
jgi:uncharacterized protein involved in exopolysaccharide biosynthesis